MNLPQIHQISADDMRKIFPSKYYQKYEYHTKVNEHEQKILNQSRNQKDDDLKWKESRQYPIPKVPPKKQYNPRFENYQSTISLNKQQVTRLNKYTKVLSLKLETTPQKKTNLIRSPFKFVAQASQNILDRLKAIQDIHYSYQLKQKQKKKKILQKKSVCKFIRKIKSTQISPRKDLSPETKITNPQFRKISSDDFNSQSLPQIQNFNNHKIKIRASFLNLNLKTNFQKKDLKNTRYEPKDQNNINIINKKDLLQQTRKIKNQVYSMQTLSLYEVQKMKKRRLQMKNTLQ